MAKQNNARSNDEGVVPLCPLTQNPEDHSTRKNELCPPTAAPSLYRGTKPLPTDITSCRFPCPVGDYTSCISVDFFHHIMIDEQKNWDITGIIGNTEVFSIIQ